MNGSCLRCSSFEENEDHLWIGGAGSGVVGKSGDGEMASIRPVIIFPAPISGGG